MRNLEDRITDLWVELEGGHYFRYGASPIWEMRIVQVQS